jgi:hypothetical protein
MKNIEISDENCVCGHNKKEHQFTLSNIVKKKLVCFNMTKNKEGIEIHNCNCIDYQENIG